MNIRTDISRLSENDHPLPAYKYINMSGYVQASVQDKNMPQIQLLQIYLYLSKSKWKNIHIF
jgi:hypothetical protein